MIWSGSALERNFFIELNAGRASAKMGSLKPIGDDHVELEDGTKPPTDLIIFATGWEQHLTLLSNELEQNIKRGHCIHVYRHILPPRVRNLGFTGYALSVAAEVGENWLAQTFHGAVSLPTAVRMDAEIERVHRWAAETMPSHSAGYFVGAHVPHYIDDLLSDVQLPLLRKADFIRENFTSLLPSRYKTLGAERRLVRDRR
jgi:dimethylaniline monooxygenase (N-oxide forming)